MALQSVTERNIVASCKLRAFATIFQGANVIRSLFMVLLAVVGLTSASISQAAAPAEVFGTLPVVQSVRMSPSGKYFAVVMNLNGQPSVRTFDANTLQQIGGIAAAKQQVISGVRWHSDDRLILTVVEVVTFDPNAVSDASELGGTNVCRFMSVSRDGKNVVQIKPPGALKDLSLSCSWVGWGSDPNSVLIQSAILGGSGLSSRSQFKADVKPVSVNILTGEGRVLDEVGSRGTFSWRADKTGAVRLRWDAVTGNEVLYARLKGSSDWREVHRQPLRDFEAESSGDKRGIVQVLGFADDLNKVYVLYWPGDRSVLGLMDLQTSQITQLHSDPKYDVGGVVSFGEGASGAFVDRDVPTQFFFDQKAKAVQASLQANYPGNVIRIVHASDDFTRIAFLIDGPIAPGGAYQILDTVKNEASMISRLYPTLDLASTGEQRYVTYTARDGMQIDAYLTLPRGTSGKGLPAIILPHGGPQARDSGGFDWLSQFFASRGYAVLQPQFRGSDGFGTKFALAGRRQWGRKMQDDVSDGVKHLIANGTIDANKVCIMGWSYGGYAALAGATLTPELYRCAIAGAGVSDLVEMLLWSREYAGGKEGSIRYWRLHIGDPTADKASIEAVSPIKHVANVKAPILLIHGVLDNVVPIKQSEIIAEALKAAGKPVEFARLANENHNITFQSTRIKTLQAMDAFLAKHNPAR
jgi:dipeptidyl aminopeptidase/acylaminoacyl peptidase